MAKKTQTRKKSSRPTKRESIKEALYEAFRQEFPNDTVDVSDGYKDNIHVLVVSRRFDDLDHQQRQDWMWQIVDRTRLTAAQKHLLSLVLPLSPADVK